jgi:hypothetical protein
MSERLESFTALSAFLTGFDEARLWGTGLVEEHLDVLDQVLGAGIVDELLGAFQRLPAGGQHAEAVETAVLGDSKLGPVARNLIVLWYSGTWTQMPADWRAAYGASELDTTRTTSGAAYRGGLQWAAAGAHPPGASHQGFGSWALEPKGRLA